MKQRSVGIAILLSIITCGIYGIYWLIMLNDETNYVSGHQQTVHQAELYFCSHL